MDLPKKAERSDRNRDETSKRVQAQGEPAAIVPATTQIPQAIIPTEMRYATAVSIPGPRYMGRDLLN